jgi:hypothetical protein
MARRNKDQTRGYLVQCSRCQAWRKVRTLEEQQAARKLGSCPSCLTLPEWRLEVLHRLLQAHLASIAEKARALPEQEREVYRALYKKRLRQAALVRQQLEPVEVAQS